jgi:Tfp pilus assembly protein PilF
MTAEQKDEFDQRLKARQAELEKNSAVRDAYNIGMTATEAKHWDEAIAAFEKAQTADPKQVAVYLGMADAYQGSFLSKKGADRDADLQKCIDAYTKALELTPNDGGIHNNYGRMLAAAGKYPEAQAEMAKAAQIDPPGAGKYYYNLGVILVNTNQSEAAVDFFKKAVEADPNYGDAYYQLGASLMSKAEMSADGKVIPAPGTLEALQKCVSLADKCQYGAQAKEALDALGSTVETSYKDPNAKKTPAKKK